MTANDVQVENPALRLARYLKKFVGLRTTTVRDVTKYESVLWFGDMPQEPDCRSAAWTDDYDADDPWLEVKKQQFEKTPAPPVSTLPWVDEQALKRATQDIAALRPTIFLPDDEAELEEGETPPLSEHSLNDHPEVQQAYDRYRPRWEAWSTEHRRREAIQRVYAELFRLHTQVRKQGEIIEVVLGLGLLDWRAKLNERVIPIRRHAVVGRVEVEFDPAKGAIRVLPPGDGARLRIEDDMLEAELRPDRTHYAAAEMQLEEIGDDIWDKGQMYTALRAWVGALSPDSQWSDGLGATASVANDPTMSFAPALILRKRTQTGMVRIYNELIGQLSNDAIEIPELWKGLIDDVGDCASDGDRGRDEQGRDRALKDPAKVYFPLAANREQRRIVEAIDRQRGVLVQGPPGTGKSHTIANLICHLLATGKRVLITAETGRALQVLKDKLPREIQPLCVSLLGQGGDAFAELTRRCRESRPGKPPIRRELTTTGLPRWTSTSTTLVAASQTLSPRLRSLREERHVHIRWPMAPTTGRHRLLPSKWLGRVSSTRGYSYPEMRKSHRPFRMKTSCRGSRSGSGTRMNRSRTPMHRSPSVLSCRPQPISHPRSLRKRRHRWPSTTKRICDRTRPTLRFRRLPTTRGSNFEQSSSGLRINVLYWTASKGNGERRHSRTWFRGDEPAGIPSST